MPVVSRQIRRPTPPPKPQICRIPHPGAAIPKRSRTESVSTLSVQNETSHKPSRAVTDSAPPKEKPNYLELGLSAPPPVASPINQLHHHLLLALVNQTTNNNLLPHVSNLTAKE
ncbi:hypothetical protein PGTUg99_014128 [Puccinia graminis f. sp. tritici]|uniref:Uncharacterized protein n=1 Tax=Puccinia graminis f. sp. tritici TaxID=56615 RepID=A0A5B0RVV9_PUCGR|nr:hypothetical protein PGTUg99_014128 [Puccinia graminis f. sp. tritici]